MANGNYPILAREGWVHMGVVVVAAALTQYVAGPAWAAPLWVATLFVVQFFRDPPRTIATTADGILAPADGRVIVLDEVEDPYLKRPARRISIFMNVFNVHSNRSPVAGQVMERWYHEGSFVNAALDKAAVENERNALWVKTDAGVDVVFVQIAGLIARRILCYAETGNRLTQGERYGFIRFGSRVDIYLPLSSRFEVALGDKVKSGLNVIATLKH
jgi:phosphatidylserine decarboxylase